MVSQQLGLLIFWVPASFFLMWAVLVMSLVLSTMRGWGLPGRSKKRYSSVVVISERRLFLLLLRFKNSTPLFKSIGVIFFVTLLALLLKEIGTDIDYSPIVPMISSLVFLSLPILTNKCIGILESRRELDFAKVGCLGWSLTLVYTIVYIVGGLLVLPILSLVSLRTLYIETAGGALSVVLAMGLQVITALIFINYFSAMSAKKEITKALNRLSEIHQRISEITLSQKATDEFLHELTELYLASQPYHISADDSLLVNFYSVVPNPVFLSRLGDE